MKVTKARIKEIILEELNEMYVTDIAGSDEDREIDRHRAAKRARGEYPPQYAAAKHSGTQSPEEAEATSAQALIQATKNILQMSPNMSLMVDQETYDIVSEMAPELMGRISVKSMRRAR